jgi:hypothetical protein
MRREHQGAEGEPTVNTERNAAMTMQSQWKIRIYRKTERW